MGLKVGRYPMEELEMRNAKIRRMGWVSILSLLSLVGSPFVGESRAQEGTSPEPQGAPYIIEDIQGNGVQVLEGGAKDWERAEEGQSVETGDEIKIGQGSEATLMLESETSVHLREGTDLKVEQIQANETNGFLSRLQIFAGSIL